MTETDRRAAAARFTNLYSVAVRVASRAVLAGDDRKAALAFDAARHAARGAARHGAISPLIDVLERAYA